VAEVSLVELETSPSSRKGSCGHPPKVWKYGAQRRGEVYSLLNETQNDMPIVVRAVPWSLRAKNREKARERIYFPVCLHLTRNRGQAQKAWWSRAERIEVLNLSLFIYYFINT